MQCNAKYGTEYYNFQRIDMHQVLLQTVLQKNGVGPGYDLATTHEAVSVDADDGGIRFDNGSIVQAARSCGGWNSITHS